MVGQDNDYHLPFYSDMRLTKTEIQRKYYFTEKWFKRLGFPDERKQYKFGWYLLWDESRVQQVIKDHQAEYDERARTVKIRNEKKEAVRAKIDKIHSLQCQAIASHFKEKGFHQRGYLTRLDSWQVDMKKDKCVLLISGTSDDFKRLKDRLPELSQWVDEQIEQFNIEFPNEKFFSLDLELNGFW